MKSLTGAAAMAGSLGAETPLVVATPPWWPSVLPSPELTAALLVGTLIGAVVAIVLTVRIVVPVSVRVVRQVRKAWRRIAPKSTFGKVMVTFCLLFVVVTAPTMVTLVDAKDVLGDVATGSSAIAEMDGDTVTLDGEDSLSRPAPDRDGDRLLDDWERQGETSSGVPLPDANPGRKDLYLQVLYGDGVPGLDADEKAALRDVFAEMPVENPDGSTGISLHIRDERSLGASASVYEPDHDVLLERYDDTHLGGATCVYYQTTFGEVEHPRLGGKAVLGGYSSMVDGTQTAVRDGRSDRVVFLTHELLHNTAGPVEGKPHTTGGWLGTTYDTSNTTLSPATAAELEDGFAVSSMDGRCGA